MRLLAPRRHRLRVDQGVVDGRRRTRRGRFKEAVEHVVERLTPLFEHAASSRPPKFINLDMEEYRDLDLTIEVFTRLLDQPEFLDLEAGIVLQAYLPDARAR